ncbi:MAG: isocitrate/isopropylmalate dehydrogenase family protein [Acidobacteriota bacterium]
MKKITVLPGDGIGPEVTSAGLAILSRIERKFSQLTFELEECRCGAGEFLRGGDPLPDSTMRSCRESDAILLGAMGMPNVRWPDGREMAPQLDLREQLDLYAGVRPVRLFNKAHSPLRNPVIDYVLVRESTEGLFTSRLRQRAKGEPEVRDELLVTRAGSERLFHFAFRLARTRKRQLTLIDKANVLPSMAFFREVFDEVAGQYPDVTAERVYVDAMAMFLVRNPERYDVLVTENMFGDILSDLAAGTVGGMGMAPSADIGSRWAVFQPAHGSAPDIAGQGKANPVGMILSVAMMLEWFGDRESVEAAAITRHAVETVLADAANATPDLGGKLTTNELTALIEAAI